MEGLSADVRRLDAKLDRLLEHLTPAPAPGLAPAPALEALLRTSSDSSGALSPDRQRIRAVLNYVPSMHE